MMKIRTLFGSILAYRAVRIALALLFLLAGMSKLFQLDIFIMILEVYAAEAPFPVQQELLLPIALFIGVLECITGIGLLFDLRGFLLLTAAQILIFIGVLIFGILLGLDVDCGCFVLHDPDQPIHDGLRPALYRDFLLLAAVGYLFLWRSFSCKSEKI